MNEELKNKEDEDIFFIPDKTISKLYDISGGVDRNKGVIMIACNENGDPIIYSKYQDSVTELGMKQALNNWLNKNHNDVSDLQ